MQHPRGRAEALGNPCFLEGPVIRPLKTFRGPDGTCLKGTTVKPGTVRTVVHHDQAEAGSSNISLNFHNKSLIGHPELGDVVIQIPIDLDRSPDPQSRLG
jgi:hypothetical protein